MSTHFTSFASLIFEGTDSHFTIILDEQEIGWGKVIPSSVTRAYKITNQVIFIEITLTNLLESPVQPTTYSAPLLFQVLSGI